MGKPFGKLFVRDETWGYEVHGDQLSPPLGVCCPVCGHDYNHVGRAADMLGWESAKDDSAAAAATPHRWAGRGDGYAIPMWCEEGHRWLLCLGFHKGNSYLFAAADKSPVTDPERCVTALLLTDVCMTSAVGETDVGAVEAAVAGWTDDQRAAAFEWAALEHLHASDNDDVKRVPCPPHVRVLRGDEWRKNRGS